MLDWAETEGAGTSTTEIIVVVFLMCRAEKLTCFEGRFGTYLNAWLVNKLFLSFSNGFVENLDSMDYYYSISKYNLFSKLNTYSVWIRTLQSNIFLNVFDIPIFNHKRSIATLGITCHFLLKNYASWKLEMASPKGPGGPGSLHVSGPARVKVY